jgi:hypothetical protein
LDADTQQVNLAADELAKYLRVLVRPFIPKVKKRYLADQIFHARGDVLEASRGEHSHGRRGMAEIRIQCQSVFVHDHLEMIAGKNRKCKRICNVCGGFTICDRI